MDTEIIATESKYYYTMPDICTFDDLRFYQDLFPSEFLPTIEQDNIKHKPKLFTFFTRENILKVRQSNYDKRKKGLKVVS